MKCDRCAVTMDPEEAREIHGMRVCEDCYMDLLSPARPCDPWSAMAAKSAGQLSGGEEKLTEVQQRILDILGQKPMPFENLVQASGLKAERLERELATLHRMEKIGAKLRDGIRRYQLWDEKD